LDVKKQKQKKIKQGVRFPEKKRHENMICNYNNNQNCISYQHLRISCRRSAKSTYKNDNYNFLSLRQCGDDSLEVSSFFPLRSQHQQPIKSARFDHAISALKTKPKSLDRTMPPPHWLSTLAAQRRKNEKKLGHIVAARPQWEKIKCHTLVLVRTFGNAFANKIFCTMKPEFKNRQQIKRQDANIKIVCKRNRGPKFISEGETITSTHQKSTI